MATFANVIAGPAVNFLSSRHIQDHNEPNTTLQQHWGYPDRVLPCTKDANTCTYLDIVYWMHDTSMLYTFIMWGVLLGIFVIWALLRTVSHVTGGAYNIERTLSNHAREFRRRWLLKETPGRWLWGRVSRLQVLLFVIMLAYLLIFSLVGIWYGTLYTPTKNPAVYTTRTGISGWADRVGAFAFALTPFAVLLGMRESLLSLMTGVPHQHFMFLHRWLGRLILVQSILHTIGWIVIETRLYQPQPTQWINFVAEEYIIFGFAALGVLVVLWLLSTKTAIRWLGYELFRLTHGLIALAYIALCWGHWPQLACWLIASIILIGLDQVARFIGFLYIHTSAKHSNGGPLFQPANAQVTVFRNPSASEKGDEDTLVRLDFDLDHRQAWSAGQHFFLTFPQLSLFQTHPFTVASLPSEGNAPHHHTYLIRAQKGQTVHLANHETLTTVLSRPYGRKFIRPSESPRHLLAVAGGSGVTFTLPLVLASLQQQKQQPVSAPVATSFIWVVRAARDLLWIAPELAQLKAALAEHPGLTIAIYITREAKGVNGNNSDAGSEADSPLHEKTHADITVAAAHDAETSSTEADVTEKRSSASSSSSSRTSLSALLAPAPRFSVTYLAGQHPVLLDVVAAFRDRVSEAAGAAAAAGDDAGTEVVGSGPPEMGTDLRVAVAEGARSVSSERFYWDARE